MFDPRTRGGGGVQHGSPFPGKKVAAWTRDPSVSTDVGPQSVPARVSVVLVEETRDRSARRLASVPVDVDEQMIAGAACPAGVAECTDGVMLPMMAGTASGGGDSGATACSGGSVWTGGIRNFAQISAFGAPGSSATASTGILPARLECSSVFLLWEGGPQSYSLSHFGRFVSFYAAGREGGEDSGWLCYDFTPSSSGASPSGKRGLIRGGGGGVDTRISSNVRPQDPRGGGGVQHGSPFPGKKLLHGLGIHLCQPT